MWIRQNIRSCKFENWKPHNREAWTLNAHLITLNTQQPTFVQVNCDIYDQINREIIVGPPSLIRRII